MKARLLQCFFVGLLVSQSVLGAAQLAFNLTDVDGNSVALADGHVTVVTIVTRKDQHDARVVGDRVPRRYYGDKRLRMLVIANMQKAHLIFHSVVNAFIRHRMDLEAKRLRPIYESRAVQRDPRQDLHIVTDFTGTDVARFGVGPDEERTQVYLLRGDGALFQHWARVPESEELADSLDAAIAAQ